MPKDMWDKLSVAGKGAALSETSQKKEDANVSMNKMITIPKEFDIQFKKAKKEGRIGGTFAGYITEAVRLKLKEDGII
jgi:hypothetical protein